MKYIVKKGTALHQKLTDLIDRVVNARKAAAELVKSYNDTYGGDGSFYPGHGINILAGGILGIKLQTKPPGWKNGGYGEPGCYQPGKKCKQDLEKFEALPKVLNIELNRLIGHDNMIFETNETGSKGHGRKIIFHPSIHKTEEGHWLVGLNEFITNYEGPVEGMEEITISEFNKRKKPTL